MYTRGRAVVGFAVLTLLVSTVVGPRLHLHPGDHDHGRTIAHSHGTGEPHSHDPDASTPGDAGDEHGTVIVLGAARVLSSSPSATVVAAPVLLPEPIATVATAGAWVPAPDTTPTSAHGPPPTNRLPARAPPFAPLQFS